MEDSIMSKKQYVCVTECYHNAQHYAVGTYEDFEDGTAPGHFVPILDPKGEKLKERKSALKVFNDELRIFENIENPDVSIKAQMKELKEKIRKLMQGGTKKEADELKADRVVEIKEKLELLNKTDHPSKSQKAEMRDLELELKKLQEGE